jgi:hypothetical protein
MRTAPRESGGSVAALILAPFALIALEDRLTSTISAKDAGDKLTSARMDVAAGFALIVVSAFSA